MGPYTSEYSDEEKQLIQSEFSRIKETYLDHAGTTLYSEVQIKSIHENLVANVYCNPHTSKTTEDLIDQVRFRILKHFNTNSSKYTVIFTSGATNSLKLVAESFSFAPVNDESNNVAGNFIYAQDNHTSVLGMREVVNTTKIKCIKTDDILKELAEEPKPLELPSAMEYSLGNSLLLVSAQCNFSGYKLPLEAIDYVQRHGLKCIEPSANSRWFVCLDAASYASTNFLDLNKWSPDFVCISFYKMFGYPTGLGALLVRNTSQYVINKKYYGGGTVKIAMSQINWHRKRDAFQERLEDGTIPFLSIIALLQGFNTLHRLISPKENLNTMQRISKHTFNLAQYCYNGLRNLKYANGQPMVKFYSDTEFTSSDRQGGIVNFNLLHSDGSYIGFAEVGYMATIYNITLRTGCFCNPGACQRHLALSDEDLKRQYNAGHICGDSNDLVDGVPTGSVRISFGYMTTKENVDAVLDMIVSCYQNENKIAQNLSLIKKNYKVRPNKLSNEISTESNVKLKAICVYPIKSCSAFKVYDKWSVSAKGLLYDREWMIVNDNGVALTQKTSTDMCLIQPAINLIEKTMTLSYPNCDSIEIPLEVLPQTMALNSGTLCHSKVCGDQIEGIDYGDTVGDWLSNALNISGLRLIKQIDHIGRRSKNSTTQISLSNQSQFLLINCTSVLWLAEKVDDWVKHGLFPEFNLPSVIDRFRGNFIIESAEPLAELNWKYFQIGNVVFKAEGPCTRCQMICIDQNTGIKTTEPLKTIAREFQGKMKFGLYLTNTTEVTEGLSISTNDIISIA